MRNYQLCLLHMSMAEPEPHSVEILRAAVSYSLDYGVYVKYDDYKIVKKIYEAYLVFSENYLNLPRTLTE